MTIKREQKNIKDRSLTVIYHNLEHWFMLTKIEAKTHPLWQQHYHHHRKWHDHSANRHS